MLLVDVKLLYGCELAGDGPARRMRLCVAAVSDFAVGNGTKVTLWLFQLTVRVNSLYYRYVNYIEGQVPLFGDKGKPVQCRRGHATV